MYTFKYAKDNMDRYSRNKLTDFIGENGQEKLAKAKVLILGAGGVGSFVLMNLAALGIGHIGIVDNDTVNETNLNRQLIYNMDSIGKYKVHEAKKWVEKFNPNIDVKTYCIRLDKNNCVEIYKDYNILVDAFDTAKSVEIINETAVEQNKILIHAAVYNTQGTVMTTIPHKTACFRCFTDSTSQNENDEEQVIAGAIAPTVSLVASIEVFEVLKIIFEKGNLFTNSPLIIEGVSGASLRPKIYQNKEKKCPVCGLPLLDFVKKD